MCGMKNITSLVFLLLIMTVKSFSQTAATSVTYNKEVQPAVLAKIPYDEDVAQDFIVGVLQRNGVKTDKGSVFSKKNEIDGFYVTRNVNLQGLNYPVDLYWKIEGKGKRSNKESIVYLMAAKNNNFASSGSDEPTYSAARDMLNNFSILSEAYELNLKIQEQEETIKDAEKKLEKLQDNEKSLSKKLDQLQKDIKENKDDQGKQNETVEKEKKKLEDLKSSMKKYS
jgi:hypothetical protein